MADFASGGVRVGRRAAARGSGVVKLMIAAVLLAKCFLPPSVSALEEGNPSEILASLEKELSRIKTVQADFVQTKTLVMFRQKLIIKGSIAVENPDRVAWHVNEPVRYSFVVKGGKLTQWDEDTDKVQSFPLDKDPAFKAAFQQLTAWFSGQYTRLLENYDVVVEQEAPCILLFTPKPKSMAADIIAHVRVTFRSDRKYLDELVISEMSGNVTVIAFSNARLDEPISEKTWKVRRSE